MSYCSIIAFKEGKADSAGNFGNAWGGAAFIWTVLFDKYLKDPEKEHDNWLSRCADESDRSLWDLAKRDDLPNPDRV